MRYQKKVPTALPLRCAEEKSVSLFLHEPCQGSVLGLVLGLDAPSRVGSSQIEPSGVPARQQKETT